LVLPIIIKVVSTRSSSLICTETHHRLMSKTSVDARLNNALFLSKSWSSPRSLPSVPSTSMTIVEENLDGHIQIPVAHAELISWIDLLLQRDHVPFVVCCLLVSSITSNVVPKRRLSSVPVACQMTFECSDEGLATYSCRYSDFQRPLRHRMQIPCPAIPISTGILTGTSWCCGTTDRAEYQLHLTLDVNLSLTYEKFWCSSTTCSRDPVAVSEPELPAAVSLLSFSTSNPAAFKLSLASLGTLSSVNSALSSSGGFASAALALFIDISIFVRVFGIDLDFQRVYE
jgi:hypothetical protein